MKHETQSIYDLLFLLPLPSTFNRCVPVFLHQDPSLLTCIHNITTWTGTEEKGNNDMHLYKLSNLQHDIRVKFPSVTRCLVQLLTTCRTGSVVTVTSVTSVMISVMWH